MNHKIQCVDDFRWSNNVYYCILILYDDDEKILF